MSVPQDFAGRVAFVSGGASGIGLACGRRLAEGGASVALCDRDTGALAQVTDALRGEGFAVEGVEIDVSDSAAVGAAIAGIVRAHGRLHLALNSAGVAPTGQGVADYDEAAWRRLHEVNLHGVFLCMKHEMAAMRAGGGGSIVNIASVLGVVAAPFASAYVASKHAVIGLSKAAALEGATDGVRVNALCPGFIDTPLLRREAGDRIADIIARHPVGRLGTSEEVAEFAAFLLSDRAGFVTGAAHVIDGGYSAL